MTAADVITGDRLWAIEQGDCIQWAKSLPDDSIDLFCGSPPYEAQRTYSIGFNLRGQAWVDWMVEVVRALAPKVKGLIVIVCEGFTKDFKYSATPLLLAADLHRAGFCLRKPPVFVRVGIPGSGGKKADHEENGGSAEWLRNDYEFCLCVTRGGRLPWADALACGHRPKWAPGGEMSHRQADGARVNQWCHHIDSGGTTQSKDDITSGAARPSHHVANGKHKTRKKKGVFRHSEDASSPTDHDRLLNLAIANPGNVINEVYTAEQVHELLALESDVTRHLVGGGVMGHSLTHENEAPFPLTLASFFVRSFCPPGGITADCWSGSGTVAHAAIENGRRFVGCDVRESQVDLTRRRLETVTPAIPGMA